MVNALAVQEGVPGVFWVVVLWKDYWEVVSREAAWKILRLISSDNMISGTEMFLILSVYKFSWDCLFHLCSEESKTVPLGE